MPTGEPPPTLTGASWPDKPFFFNGEWQEITLGSPNTAGRNRKRVYVPVYAAADGETFCYMPLQRATPPEGNDDKA